MPTPARSTDDTELLTLRMIRNSVRDRGYPPTQREISAEVGWASPSGANNLLRLMEARGLIRLAPGIPRGLQVTDEGEKMIASTEAV